jgi:hypothetical protein
MSDGGNRSTFLMGFTEGPKVSCNFYNLLVSEGFFKTFLFNVIRLFGILQFSISSWIPAFAGMTDKNVTD